MKSSIHVETILKMRTYVYIQSNLTPLYKPKNQQSPIPTHFQSMALQ